MILTSQLKLIVQKWTPINKIVMDRGDAPKNHASSRV